MVQNVFQGVALVAGAFIDVPVHVFWLCSPARLAQDASGPTQTVEDAVCPWRCLVPSGHMLGRIVNLMALASSEDAVAVDHHNTLAAPMGWTKEPLPLANPCDRALLPD